MLVRGETTEDRIAKIAQGFNQGAQNFIVGQNNNRAKDLQDEALRRQQALQAFDVENKIAETTGRIVEPGTGLKILGGEAYDLKSAIGSGQKTYKAEQFEQEKLRQQKNDERQLNNDNVRNKKYLNDIATSGSKGQAKVDDQKYKSTDSIRKEIYGLPVTKSVIEIDNALSKIKSAPKTAAGDMSRVFGYMKVQDPNSTVREGEYANAQNAAGIPDQIRAKYNRALNGELLTDGQRADFENSASELARSQYKTFYSATAPHRKRMSELGLDSSQIFPSFSQQEVFDSQGSARPINGPGRITDSIPKNVHPDIVNRVKTYSPEQRALRIKELEARAGG